MRFLIIFKGFGGNSGEVPFIRSLLTNKLVKVVKMPIKCERQFNIGTYINQFF